MTNQNARRRVYARQRRIAKVFLRASIQMNSSRQQLIAYKCRVLSSLADTLAPSIESSGARQGLKLIADTLQEVAVEITHLEPEEIPLRQALEQYGLRRPNSLARS
ncbi:MAG TPA: hypothetical protein VE641_10510 [Chthoniobacterales bacterium]|jgi:division protein CdvB (Snf7/Vps24/ESCRT-III family)|nr:hypothetical protein [Chthoniobacterales bacterium]